MVKISEIGDTICANNQKYKLLCFLGKGKGGYSYLVENLAGHEQLVFKQIHYEANHYFQFEDNKLASELAAYERLKAANVPLPKLIFADNDAQFLLKEYISGPTLADLAASGKVTEELIHQLFHICDQLYPRGLNIDYFPTNFVLQAGLLYYIDYETSAYTDEWNFENWGIWFLANRLGFNEYLKTGADNTILEAGKPLYSGFEQQVSLWLRER